MSLEEEEEVNEALDLKKENEDTLAKRKASTMNVGSPRGGPGVQGKPGGPGGQGGPVGGASLVSTREGHQVVPPIDVREGKHPFVLIIDPLSLSPYIFFSDHGHQRVLREHGCRRHDTSGSPPLVHQVRVAGFCPGFCHCLLGDRISQVPVRMSKSDLFLPFGLKETPFKQIVVVSREFS